jgi:hypothetical protein
LEKRALESWHQRPEPQKVIPKKVINNKHRSGNPVETTASEKRSQYSSAYLAPRLPTNIIQKLLNAGFEYHLPANNDSGFWTHPLIVSVLFSTHQAFSRLGFSTSEFT